MGTDTLATQGLEEVLKGQSSPETEEVSGETPKAETVSEETPEADESKKNEQEKAIIFSTEQEDEIEKRFQSRRDKDLNPYREKREADTALIRSLTSQISELKSTKYVKEGDKRIESILAGDEKYGVDADEIKDREQALKEFNQLYKEYRTKSGDVEEVAQVISSMAEKLPANIVKEFGLNDANPHIRAVNGAKFLDETASVYRYSQNFLMVVQDFLPKGEELRKQIEEIIDGLSEFTDEKSKRLYLKDRLRGVAVTPRKKPQTPSNEGGGNILTSGTPEERITQALIREKRR